MQVIPATTQVIPASRWGVTLLAALGGLLTAFALALAWPGHALGQEGEEPVEFVGAPANTVEFDENALGEIGTYLARAQDGSPIEYSLTGPDADDFYISNLDGDAGTIYNNRSFDFEDVDDKSLSFTVNATSASLGHTATLDVTVTVGDKNDRPSFGAYAFECGFLETDRSGSSCFDSMTTSAAGRHFACASVDETCLATDDEGDRLTYSLADDWRMADYLDIDPGTGAVTLSDAGAGRLDFEGRSEFTVGIRVSDGKDADGNPDTEIDDRAVVRVVVQDVVFEPPRLSSAFAWPRSESMRVVWTTDMATAQQYRVKYLAVGDSDWTEHDLAGTLRQGFGYVYSKDLSSDDSRQLTITVTDVLERPDSPLLAADEQGSNSVRLSWATPDAGDQSITGYYVQYREVDSSRWHTTRFIDGTQTIIEGLQPGTAYEFRGIAVGERLRPVTWSDRDTAPMLTVSTEPGTAQQSGSKAGSAQGTGPSQGSGSSKDAQDRTREAGPNSAAADTPAIPRVPPAAPQNLTAAAAADGTVALSWDAPDDPSITGYQVLRKLRGTRDLQVHVDNTGSVDTAFADPETEPGQRYVYRVKAINAAGISDWSNYVRVTAR